MGLSQEWLKVIACVTMLMDHIGAAFFPWALWWRIVGRMAFPIYCFLLAEGMARTRDVKLKFFSDVVKHVVKILPIPKLRTIEKKNPPVLYQKQVGFGPGDRIRTCGI